MARAVQKVALKCEQANETGVLGKFILKVSNILSFEDSKPRSLKLCVNSK